MRSESISVVIPSYNSARSLQLAIESVARQTLAPLEVIVVDDASNDSTVESVRALQSTYHPGWLKLIELDRNVGAASARNFGWDASDGTHIAFLDSDDLWHPRKLEIQWNQFKRQPELALSGHSFRFPWESNGEMDSDGVAVSISRSQILWRNPFVTPSVMLRKNLPFRFKSGKRHMEDHLLWMEIVLSGYKASRLNLHLSTINKAQFGASGLSSQLWAMQMGELDNYCQLHRQKYINTPTAAFFLGFSLVKFARRLFIVAGRRAKAFIQGG
ncbi:MAG: glycosyltransferase family 2 protein [Hydrogenophaga sp.]|uniref:glycosyltransferase family 2 protein n=1 Tax=Hydrogenophaga sp. TaxID=1904254 RepID=UPI0027348458|nr:glycosyltransferase family 2 protein [Hydrogenophaga sp.]MDP3349057.1 glycosyltransferase family 2 protein [Hydrogenophaga sp.]